MRRDSAMRRLVVAYLATEVEEEVREIARKLRTSLKSSKVYVGSEQSLKEAGVFSRIKLAQETLITILVRTEELADAIQLLQFAGSRSVFIFSSVSALAVAENS